ncbi:DUF1566 domain-containing protein [Piscinibacter sp. XHJ-5]|uniref:Lcl C-terminal domain-containing protein n=1 Tax=Piscinibacter sp. XHJ-5 TaxID=3037797 RepID=UPI002452BD32|nr:DUF1566 domain-containing protein [Piscinibacter sp. XHJ-5]
MNFRKLTIAMCCMAALAALYETAQAAAAAGGTDLRGVTQNWDKVLPSETGAGCPNWSTRFTCVMNNSAVRDNETGLVWTHPLHWQGQPWPMSWHHAKLECANLAVGNRKGWRLPSVTELASLIDMSNPAEVKLPANRPFIYQQTPQGHAYWTSTPLKQPLSDLAPEVYVVGFQGGWVATIDATYFQGLVWCVRGGQPPASGY